MFEAHLTQLEVARRVGVTPKTLSRIVNGHTLPSEKTTVAFAKVVEGDAEQLWAEVATYRLAETMRQAGWGRR
jgi:DNA-binding XRE family transcriptional regulator